MALMTKIRNNLAKLFAVLAVFFILYIFFEWGLDLTGRKDRGFTKGVEFAEINGKEITYKEFSDRVHNYIENWKNQNNKQDVDEQTELQIRSQVWNELVETILMQQEMDRLNIKVTDQEIRDFLLGPNPPEFLAQQFRDSLGVFHRDMYISAITDPRNKEILINVEEMVRKQLAYAKLQRLILATAQVSESELKQSFIENNITLKADYIFFNVYRMVPDSAVTITEEEIRNYYDSHPENFRAKPARRVKYVSFSQKPSSNDTLAVEKDAEKFLQQVKSGSASFEDLVNTYSEIPSPDVFFKHGELGPSKENAIFSARKGEIVGPIKDYDGIHLIKIVDEKRGQKEHVRVRHILLRFIPGPDSLKVLKRIQELYAKARSGRDFAQLARENSQDYATAWRGGEIGWISKEGWEKPLTNAAFKARKGEIVGPIRGTQGWHIINVIDKDNRELKILDLALKIRPSLETIEKANEQAQEFAILAKEEGFEKAAENSKLEVKESGEFNKGGYIPGIGVNEALMSFAWNNKLDAISEPIRLKDEIIVAKLSKIRDENIRPFDEIKSAAQAMAIKDKKMVLLKEKVEAFYKALTPNTDIVLAAKSIPNVHVQQAVTFKPSETIPGLGRDMRFVGAVLSLQSGQLSKPVEGENGYYIIKLISKTDFDSLKFDAERDLLMNRRLQEKRQKVFSEWQRTLREEADIVDNREQYFR